MIFYKDKTIVTNDRSSGPSARWWEEGIDFKKAELFKVIEIFSVPSNMVVLPTYDYGAPDIWFLGPKDWIFHYLEFKLN